MTAFSRLQLAAALLEYDNDDTNPNAPRRSAHDSAIFAHLRRNLPRRPAGSRKSADQLGAYQPSESGSGGLGDTRKSRGSIDALRNPFGRDSTYDGHYEDEENVEVDLSSWGLDAFIPKDKEKRPKKGKAKSDVFPNPHPPTSSGHKRADGSRTASVSNLDSFGEGGAFLDAKSVVSVRTLDARRHSIGSAFDLVSKEPAEHVKQRRASTHALIENLPVTPPLHAIPFPTAPSARSISPVPDEAGPSALRPSSRASRLDPSHGRTYSTASMGSKMLAGEGEPNPFAVKPPSPDRMSRFDPKFSAVNAANDENNNPFAVRPPSPSRSSRFDPKAVRARTMSNGTLGTQMLLGDGDGEESVYSARAGLDRPYTRSELMRPKVLIMPSPLQSAAPPPSQPSPTRPGFEITTDGRPLPPGARSARAASVAFSVIDPSPSLSVPIASNSFTPNPRSSLTLSQLTFRNNLVVDGQRDVAYADIDDGLRRATEDGEQIIPEPEPVPQEADLPLPSVVIDEAPPVRGRPAGKLFGKSLIDDLEARKAEMKGKQRVFRGDDRPSMMARPAMQRSSTLIDPESLKHRPTSQNFKSHQSVPDLTRRNSANVKTLITFDDEIPGAPTNRLSVNPLMTGNTRSVFGVDTLWERELTKLHEIEARERVEEEERKKREAEEEAKRSTNRKKGKGKKKGKDEEPAAISTVSTPNTEAPPEPSPPPVLPAIQKASAQRRAPPPPDDDESEDSEDSDASEPIPQRKQKKQAEGWHESSDEEEKGPSGIYGSGPRYPNNPPRRPVVTKGDDSEEDLPLVATIGRAAQRATRANLGDDSEEEEPLSVLLDKTKQRLPSLSGSVSSTPRLKVRNDDADEDDTPLGIRASRLMSSSQGVSSLGGGGEDDDRPLALHPEQIRRSHYMMAQQQQQQQMMMQAQMHQSMIFGNPAMMGSGFFGPPMAPPMMIPPQLATTPPPIPDVAKFGRVDKWRHDVAVEGGDR